MELSRRLRITYRRIRNFVRFALGLTRRERIGLLVIYPAALLLLFLSTWYDTSELMPHEADFLEYELTRLTQPDTDIPARTPLSPFLADTVSEQQLRDFGLPPVLAASWVRYREKSGGFRSADQLRKLYAMNDSLFRMLTPFLIWPEKHPEPGRRQQQDALDMNLADTLLWQSLRGIGPVLSKRIVAYRTALGGFVSNQQLREVYGLDSAVCARLLPRVYVARGFQPRTLDLSKATYAELRAHPYISSRQASAIVMYRAQHEPLDSVAQLLEIHHIDQAFLHRIAPYIRLRLAERQGKE